jgi:hypothetical protein
MYDYPSLWFLIRRIPMPILQVNFKLNVSVAEYHETCNDFAPAFADVPGLLWKVWLLNEAEGEAGGIYLFSSDESLQSYLASPIVAHLKSNPAFREINVKIFGVMENVTALTRGPVPAMAR